MNALCKIMLLFVCVAVSALVLSMPKGVYSNDFDDFSNGREFHLQCKQLDGNFYVYLDDIAEKCVGLDQLKSAAKDDDQLSSILESDHLECNVIQILSEEIFWNYQNDDFKLNRITIPTSPNYFRNSSRCVSHFMGFVMVVGLTGNPKNVEPVVVYNITDYLSVLSAAGKFYAYFLFKKQYPVYAGQLLRMSVNEGYPNAIPFFIDEFSCAEARKKILNSGTFSKDIEHKFEALWNKGNNCSNFASEWKPGVVINFGGDK